MELGIMPVQWFPNVLCSEKSRTFGKNFTHCVQHNDISYCDTCVAACVRLWSHVTSTIRIDHAGGSWLVWNTSKAFFVVNRVRTTCRI